MSSLAPLNLSVPIFACVPLPLYKTAEPLSQKMAAQLLSQTPDILCIPEQPSTTRFECLVMWRRGVLMKMYDHDDEDDEKEK